jgi:hypothetical protein
MRRLVIALLTLLALLAAAAPAGARPRRPHFAIVRLGGTVCAPDGSDFDPTGVMSDGRFVLVDVLHRFKDGDQCGPEVVLVDLRTHRHRILHPPAGELASPLAIGGGGILFGNSQAGFFSRYDIARRRFQTLTCGSCGASEPDGERYAIGRRWIELEFDEPGFCGGGEHMNCGAHVSELYDIVARRGESAPPLQPTQALDLDRAKPEVPLCKPLHEPDGGFLQLLGGGIALAWADAYGPYPPLAYTIERCGTGDWRSLPDAKPAVLAGARAVLWQAGSNRSTISLSGLSLPDGRAISVLVPAPDLGSVALAGARIVAVGRDGRLRVAPLPRGASATPGG